MDKLQYVHTMEYYATVENNKDTQTWKIPRSVIGVRGGFKVQNNVHNNMPLLCKRVEIRTYFCICLYAQKKLGRAVAFGNGN